MPSTSERDKLLSAIGSGEQRPAMASDAGPHRDLRPLSLSDEQRLSAVLWLVVLVAAALGLRLLIFALGPMGDLSLAMDQESARYVALAGHLAEEQTFALSAAADDGLPGRVSDMRIAAGELDPTIGGGLRLETYRTPGYPMFLAAFHWLALPGQAVLVAQCVLGALCVLLVYHLTLGLLDSPKAALLAAGIMALHPASVAATNVLLPDLLWLTFMLAGMVLIAAPRPNPTGALAGGGVMLGLAALVQPYALILPTLLAGWIVLRRRTLAAGAGAIVMLVMAAAPVGAWMGRNYFIGFGPHLSSRPVVDRYFHTLADMRRTAGEDASVTALAAQVMEQRGEGEAVLAAMDRLTREAIGQQSGLYLATLKRNAVHLFTDHSLETVYRQLGLSYAAPEVGDAILVSGFVWQNYSGTEDDATFAAALGWTILNGLLLLAAVIGLVVMVVRGKVFGALLLVGLIGFAVADLHSGLYGRPQLPALAFEAALIGGLLVARPRPIRVKVRKTREQKQLEKMRRRQQQAIGVEESVNELTPRHDPIIPGQGPREGIRPI